MQGLYFQIKKGRTTAFEIIQRDLFESDMMHCKSRDCKGNETRHYMSETDLKKRFEKRTLIPYSAASDKIKKRFRDYWETL